LAVGNYGIDNKTRLDKDTTFGRTLLQVDSTVIVGVLFFLTLNSYLGFLPQNVGRSIIGFLTLSAIIPFVTSVFLIISNERSNWAIRFTKYGFVYLAVNLMATLALPFFAGIIPTLPVLPSAAEECVQEPGKLNLTHRWQCSMFSGSTLAEQCWNYPGRFGFSRETISQCSSLIPPSNLSG
jgi:hypothetical protein